MTDGWSVDGATGSGGGVAIGAVVAVGAGLGASVGAAVAAASGVGASVGAVVAVGASLASEPQADANATKNIAANMMARVRSMIFGDFISSQSSASALSLQRKYIIVV